MNYIYVDFETRSDVDLEDSGFWRYAESPITSPICLAYKRRGAATKIQYFLGQGIEINTACPFTREELETAIFVAHNAHFERTIWEQVCSKKWGWSFPKNWRCTMARLATLGMPRSLEQGAIAMQLPYQKDIEGHRLMQKMCKPRKPLRSEVINYMIREGIIKNKNQAYPELIQKYCKEIPLLWIEDRENVLRLGKYCATDVDVLEALHIKIGNLTEQEQRIFEMDYEINKNGMPVNIQQVQNLLSLKEEANISFDKKAYELTNGKIESTRQTKALQRILKKSVPNLQKKTIEDTLQKGEMDDLSRTLLQLRQDASLSSLAKLEAISNTASSDDRVRGCLLYYGALHTGRWAGRNAQPQNLPRGSDADMKLCLKIADLHNLPLLNLCYDRPMKALSQSLRALVQAPKGKILVGGDFKSIEAVVLAWLSEAIERLKAFREKKDLYKITAAGIYGKPEIEIAKNERQVGKVCELAFGYQGSIGAFLAMATAYGVSLPEAAILALVKKWRANNPAIVNLWYAVEKAAVLCVHTQTSRQIKNVKFVYKNEALYCILPSGRYMRYPEIKVEDGKLSYYGRIIGAKFGRVSTYGGKLVENIVQGISRDILAEALLRIYQAGLKIVLHVHDEIVIEGLPKDEELFTKLIGVLPEWCKDLPLGVETWSDTAYTK